jgi:hypothetical protein
MASKASLQAERKNAGPISSFFTEWPEQAKADCFGIGAHPPSSQDLCPTPLDA